MKVNRRHLIQMMAASAGAAALGWFIPDILRGMMGRGEQKGVLNPSGIPKYADQLVKPQSFVPDPTTGIFNISASSFTSQMLPAGKGYRPTTVFGFGGLVRDAATGLTKEYKSVPGATFETIRGEPAMVRWINEITGPYILPVDTTIHWANPKNLSMAAPPEGFPPFPPGVTEAQSPVPVVTHLHGGEDPPEYDGHPEAWFTADGLKGTTFITDLYTYLNTQPATTLWYHDHTLGNTRLNMYAGLFGFYIIRDREDKIAPLLPQGEYEIPLAIQDCMFYEADEATGHNELYYPTVGDNPDVHPYWKSDVLGDVITVNGRAWPNLNVDQGQYRFRLLNASSSRFYNLFFSNGMEFVQIGSDGGYLMAPAKLKTLLISPAERADILADFSKMRPGDKIILNNNAIAPYPGGKAPDPNTAGQVMQFTVTDRPGFSPNKLPSALNPTLAGTAFPTLATGEVTRTLTLTNVAAPVSSYILLLDGQTWSAPVSETPVNGTTEDWVIANITHATHPIHVHLIMFQLVSRQAFDKAAYAEAWARTNDAGSPARLDLPLKKPTVNIPIETYLQGKARGPEENERGWKDTVQMNPREVTRIRIRFAPQDRADFPFDPTREPGYVWHCHILDHEDNEMMRPYKVVKKSWP